MIFLLNFLKFLNVRTFFTYPLDELVGDSIEVIKLVSEPSWG